MHAELLARAPRSWIRRTVSEGDVARELAAVLGLPLPVCRLLESRGHRSDEAARRFLRPRIEHLHDPRALAGLDAAVDRLRTALRRGETILVHGDYDVDGVASAALFTRVLRELGGRAEAFVPHRTRDGYDLGDAGLERAREVGASVLLTADCGIVAHDAVARARRGGLDVIVTDHHTPAATLPDALAVVNPNRPDCAYPEKGLCGAGVAFKVCQALVADAGGDEERLLWHLDLVGLATIADLVPLRGENRVFAHYGLKVLGASRKPGVRALVAAAGLGDRDRLAAGQVSHVLAPRINAAGRLGEAAWGLQLLLTESEGEARALAQRLEEVNRERRDVDRATLSEAMTTLERSFDPDADFGVVLAGEGWHPGVIGIVASRVVERIHRPTALVALNGAETARGSARSIRGFDLYGAIHRCGEHLERYGGHRQAAGFDVRPNRVDAFRAAFNARSREMLDSVVPVPVVEFDDELSLGTATPELCRMLAYLGPFGVGNPSPVFVARGVRLGREPRRVGGSHLSMELADGPVRLRAIGFGLAERFTPAELAGVPLDVAFRLEADEYRGGGAIQAKLVDVDPSPDAGVGGSEGVPASVGA